MKSKNATALLAIFLGGLGVHRFYLGQVGLGILYLIFFWTFIPLIISFFDFIAFLSMSEYSFDLKYNSIYLQSDNSSSPPEQVNIYPNKESDLDRLEKLGKLRDSGVLTEEEFQINKRKILEN